VYQRKSDADRGSHQNQPWWRTNAERIVQRGKVYINMGKLPSDQVSPGDGQ
jgi:hypothetical protein